MQKGFTPILILIRILVIVAIAGGAYYFGKLPIKPTNNNPKACTQEAKICPDGSSVGRSGPNCEFTPCFSASPKLSNETTNWKIYTNNKYGYSIKYPSSLLIESNEACGYTDTDYESFVLFKKNVAGKYLCGSDEPTYFGIDHYSEDNPPASSNDPCFTITKQQVLINGVEAEKSISIFDDKNETCRTRGIGPISNRSVSVLIVHNNQIFTLGYWILDINENIFDQILSTFRFTQ